MHIKWNALAQTAGISFGITVAVVAVFALGIVALSRRGAAQTAAREGAGSAGSGLPALVGAYTCFAACAAVVGYGLVLIAGH
ncbi:hypothetical protein ACFQ6N_21245 [Kitasatospora sp. NPDC056446]|uniref:hypothetical protein n=1 Tax=Kitasatospora sp. NPDC056446 TaxID=3345819 RepID=UPI0036A18DD8